MTRGGLASWEACTSKVDWPRATLERPGATGALSRTRIVVDLKVRVPGFGVLQIRRTLYNCGGRRFDLAVKSERTKSHCDSGSGINPSAGGDGGAGFLHP